LIDHLTSLVREKEQIDGESERERNGEKDRNEERERKKECVCV